MIKNYEISRVKARVCDKPIKAYETETLQNTNRGNALY